MISYTNVHDRTPNRAPNRAPIWFYNKNSMVFLYFNWLEKLPNNGICMRNLQKYLIFHYNSIDQILNRAEFGAAGSK